MKPILRFLCILGWLTPVLSGCQFGPFHIVEGNGHIIREERAISGFRTVDATGFMNVYLTQGDGFHIQLEGESNILPYIETRLEGNKLIVGTLHSIDIKTNERLNVYITAPRFDKVDLAGSGNIVGKSTLDNPESIKFNLGGSGNINADVDAPDVESSLNGSGRLQLTGQTRQLKIEIGGSADFVSDSLKSESADVTIMGSGSAYLFASMNLKVTIMGSGDVYYLGNPAISSHIMGSGSVRKKG
jgi:hypothetical protein